MPEDAAIEAALNRSEVLGNTAASLTAPPLDSEQAQADAAAISVWAQRSADNVRIVRDRLEACDRLALGADGCLSLLSLPGGALEPPQVVFVQWVIAGSTGRVASLDAENRVKCIVPVGEARQPRTFPGAATARPSIGVRMVRARGRKGEDRPT
eukprot:1408493-Alexandrium_andersonii.AAC.1